MTNQENIERWKIRMANEIAGTHKVKDYDVLLEYIYENQYRKIHKVPTEMFFAGIIAGISKMQDLDNANRLLRLLKEVVIDALEYGGVEVEFNDDSWDRLEFELGGETYHNNTILKRLKLKESKAYLGGYFA